MDVAEKITLVFAVFWAVLQLLSIRDAMINGKSIFPAMVPAFFLFVGAIAAVLIFHLSPLHLIWLAVLCALASVPVMIIPPVQAASMRFLLLLAMTASSSEEEETSPEKFSDILTAETKPPKQNVEKTSKGFGT